MTRTITLELAQLIEAEVRDVAKNFILPKYRSLNESEKDTKDGPLDWVTVVDKAVESELSRRILALAPEAFVTGEEALSGDLDARNELATNELCFLIDPLDGTWNFVSGIPVFGVIVAGMVNGKTMFSMLYDPIGDDWIFAHDDIGTFARDHRGKNNKLQINQNEKSLSETNGMIWSFAFPSDQYSELSTNVPKLGSVRSLLCSCHEYKILCEGTIDFLLAADTKPWDHAAGTHAYRLAGGYVEALDTPPLDSNAFGTTILAARSPQLWQEIQRCLLPCTIPNKAMPNKPIEQTL